MQYPLQIQANVKNMETKHPDTHNYTFI